jgi:hypothetical protein
MPPSRVGITNVQPWCLGRAGGFDGRCRPRRRGDRQSDWKNVITEKRVGTSATDATGDVGAGGAGDVVGMTTGASTSSRSQFRQKLRMMWNRVGGIANPPVRG